MSEVQPIIHNGRLAALVIDGHAIISERVPQPDEWTVKAMCLYALEIAAGRLPGPLQRRTRPRLRAAAAAARN